MTYDMADLQALVARIAEAKKNTPLANNYAFARSMGVPALAAGQRALAMDRLNHQMMADYLAVDGSAAPGGEKR